MTDEERTRLGEIYLKTNNATHIQQFVLALLDAGFEAETTWHDDGCYVQVFWRSRVVDGTQTVTVDDLADSSTTTQTGEDLLG